MTPARIPLTHNDYTVGWVSALTLELTAATAMLEERHPNLPKPADDPNAYTLGSIAGHNIVIACLPTGKIGNNAAATVATQMVRTFPSIRFGLMVGIGAGVPPKVRLGDVVVSTPTGEYPGVVQWDLGKAEDGGEFKRTGALNNPPVSLLTAVTQLRAEHALTGSRVPEYLEELKQKYPALASTFLRSDSLEDVLFKASYSHVDKTSSDDDEEDEEEGDEGEEASCPACDRAMTVKRKPRPMMVHYGLIASGDQVVKDAMVRNRIKKALKDQVLCIEMEAAGLMDTFPCIVIRGICDYADSHKNKRWQDHAAAVAAAFAKELLHQVQPRDVKGERAVQDILHQVQVDIQKAGEKVEAVKAKLDRKEDIEVLEWLTTVNYGPQQSDYFSRRQPGTGQWLLDSANFKAWVEGEKLTLFCPGIPGSGKTILTSIVIEKLITELGNDDTIGIAYLYCNFRRKSEQTAPDLLASVLKQLAQQRPRLPAALQSLYDKHKRQQTRPSFSELTEALRCLASEYSEVFVVVDALDELSASDGCCSKLLSEIREVGVNLFATSRFVPDITAQFEGPDCLREDIRATDEDLKGYIHGHIQGNMPQLRRHIEDFPQLMEEIIGGITSAADGMFLLAVIYLASLNDKTTPKRARAALAELQKQRAGSKESQKVQQLSKAYDRTMERIAGQEPGFWKLARDALAWITYAKRQLTTAELRHALGVEKGTSVLDRGNLPRIELIVSVCGGLVTVDGKSDVIRLAHYTVQEYFERTHGTWFPGAQADITDVCLTYLSFDAFESGMCDEANREFEERLESHPLYHYAACNWAHHACESPRLTQAAVDFLRHQAKAAAAMQALLAVARPVGWHIYHVPSHTTGLHLAAFLGVHEAVDFFSDAESLNMRDSIGRTPLRLAAEVGQAAVVQRLLATNRVDVNLEDTAQGHYATPLAVATMGGHEDVACLLLETDQVDVNRKNYFGHTPLHLAAERGSEVLVKRLVERGEAAVDPRDTTRCTPLGLAARSGHDGVVKLLLETGRVDVNSRNELGWTPLAWAACEGHDATVRLLLGTGKVEVNTRDHRDKTPLSLAVCAGHETVVRLLLATGQADIALVDLNGGTPLDYAQLYGYDPIVQLLQEAAGAGLHGGGDDASKT